MKVHNPVGNVVSGGEGKALLPHLRESRVGVFENGNENALIVMKAIVATMTERYGLVPGRDAHFDLAHPDAAVIDEVAAENEWVLVGGAD